jgi:hypothetical protein
MSEKNEHKQVVGVVQFNGFDSGKEVQDLIGKEFYFQVQIGEKGTSGSIRGDNCLIELKPSDWVIKYSDGSVSAEEASPANDDWKKNRSFFVALDWLKEGKRVRRKAWYGKDVYLWRVPEAIAPKKWVREQGLLEAIGENESIECLSFIRMKTSDGKILSGWSASETDKFSEDWELYEYTDDDCERKRDFSAAMKWLKEGRKVRRKEWKEYYYLVPECGDVKFKKANAGTVNIDIAALGLLREDWEIYEEK